jgi:hypothetical protein
MKKTLFLYITLTVQTVLHAQQAPETPLFQPTVLLEMFSSEGCSSCPLASKFMGEILDIADSTSSPVYVLDYHVDIWNRSGWVDPFSDSVHTMMQAEYMKKVGQQALFTPMLFVNGKYGLAAGERKDVGNAIYNGLSEYAKVSLTLNAAMLKNANALNVSFNMNTYLKIDSLQLVLVLAEKEIVSKPTSGENQGLTILHHHVVRRFKIVSPKVLTDLVSFELPENIDLSKFVLIGYVRNRNTWEVYTTDELKFRKE